MHEIRTYLRSIIKRPACFNTAEGTGYDGGIKRESRKDIKSGNPNRRLIQDKSGAERRE